MCDPLNADVDYEVEYNNRARVPENPAIIASWARDALAYREADKDRLNVISYGAGERQKIDLFSGGGTGPIVVFIHGGYWQALDASFFSHLAGGLNAVTHREKTPFRRTGCSWATQTHTGHPGDYTGDH